MNKNTYDIYFDFNPGLDDPYVSFISPNQNDELTGDIQIELDGDADTVELWLDGNLLTSLNSEPFEYLWTPPSGVFGDLKLIAKSMYDNGSSSFTFLDFYLLYNVVQESAPSGLKDGLNINGNDVVIALYAPGK